VIDIAKKFYITTAIDYVNSKPHLGHAYEKTLADVLARWHRLKGEDVLFLTGTDEHGRKIEKAAQNESKDPQKFVDEVTEHFRKLCKVLNISNDDFIRTTEKRHIDVVIEIFKKVLKKQEIYKGFYEGLYCTSCENYYTEAECPDGKCPIHKTSLEYLKEESYFFKLSKYKEKILDYIEENESFILPETRKNELVNRLQDGLKDLSVSRTSVKWGIPLPNDTNHVQYVWFDALLNYVSALEYPGKKFKKYWPADVQVIGKDIIWFHTVIWPAILLAAGIKLPKTVYVHGFITKNGEKLSKTLGIAIDPFHLVEKYGSDALRYFLIRSAPTGEDVDYTEEALIKRINSELADDLGNLVNRVLVLVEKNFHGKVPKPSKKISKTLTKEHADFYTRITTNVPKAVEASIEKYQFHNALNDIWFLIGEANKFVNNTKPWEIDDKEKLATVLYDLLEILRFIAILLYPFLPETSEKILNYIGWNKRPRLKDLKWKLLKPETKTRKGEILFKKIEYGEQKVY